MAQPQGSFVVRALVAVVTFIGRDLIAPPLSALARGLARAIESLVRWLAPWVLGLLALLSLIHFGGEEEAKSIVAAVAAFGFMAVIVVVWLRMMKGGGKKGRR